MPDRLPVIPYEGPPQRVCVTIPVAHWCPVSHEPQAQSTLTIEYVPWHYLLDITDLSWLSPTPAWPRDLEAAVVFVAEQVRVALEVQVQVQAAFVLANGVTVACRYPI